MPAIDARFSAVDFPRVGTRRARARDLPFIVSGERRYVRLVDPGQEAAWVSSLGSSIDLWADSLPFTTIVDVGGIDAGYLMWAPSGGDAMLVSLSVVPCYQRHGLGKGLLRVFVDEAKRSGAHSLRIGTHQVDTARHLYERNGFARYGVDEEFVFYAMAGG